MNKEQYRPLDGQVALVTGASSGIGMGVVKALALAGAVVGVNHPNTPEAADRVVAEIEASGGKAISLSADVSNEEQVKSMFATLIATYGTIDILVANAGLQRDAALVDMTLAEWQFVLNVNLTGQFLCAREAAREFMRVRRCRQDHLHEFSP
jgi:glucose 1-dehydrogenase